MRNSEGRYQIMNPILVTVIKPDGQRFEDTEAGVHIDKGLIILNDPTLPLEVGDLVERKLPSGLVDRFEITEPGFREGSHRLPDHFQAKVKRWQEPKEQNAATAGNVIYNLHGQNSKVNIGSVDNSTIYGGNTENAYEALRQVIETSIPEADRPALLKSAIDLENAPNDGKKGALGEFVMKASNYLQILSPYIQTISKMLG